MSVQMRQTTPTRSKSRTPRSEAKSRLARWGFRMALLALLLGIVDLAALVLARQPGSQRVWAIVVAIAPGVILLLAAGGTVLDLGEKIAVALRLREFDRREAERGAGLDGANELLGRMRQGCLLRLVIPLALISGIVALLIEAPALANSAALRVVQGNQVQSCTASLAPFTFELDNSSGGNAVIWSATPVESLRDGTPWAEVHPAQGRIGAGKQARVQVIPNVLVCRMIESARKPASEGTFMALFSAADTTDTGDAIFHVRVISDGRIHTTTLLAMALRRDAHLLPTPTTAPSPTATPDPTVTPRPVPSPTPVPPPQVHLVVAQNQDKSETCATTPPGPYTVTLDNQGSNVPVIWRFNGANGWATANPSSGTIKAGKTAEFTVTPTVCPIGSTATVERATLHLSFPRGGSQGDITLTDEVLGPPPIANVRVTQNQDASVYISCGAPTLYTITMNNLGGNVPVGWWFDFDGGPIWATPSPSSSTLAAGQGNTTITVTVLAGLAQITYNAHLRLSFPQGGYQADIPLSLAYSAGCLQ